MKRNKFPYKIAALLITVFSIGQNVSAQSFEGIQSSFINYMQKTLQEKLYVHTDKNFYLAGELLWFKIYDINGGDNKLMDAAKIAYVEILDKDNTPVEQAKIAMSKGTGNGSFYLPVSVSSGHYKLRAYTTWMRNFSPNNYFEKNISIVNSLKEITLQAQEPTVKYDVQFFPEGGSMVNGLTSKVAYRVVGSDGKGAEFNGAIVNKNNDTVIRFQPHKFGIGTFTLKPDASNAYRAVLKFSGGKVITAYLPAITKQGYVMQLVDDGAQLKVTVNATDSEAPVYLLAHTRGNIAMAQTLKIVNGSGSFLVDKNKLAEGVSHFTLFNSALLPVCERLYIKRPNQKLDIEAAVAQPGYALRNKVDVSILVKNTVKQADLSFSVYKYDSLETAKPESFYAYTWLTSELKGNVESPDYYLNENDDEALDNLMLTHGWSKYNWADIMQAGTPKYKYLPEYGGHNITGKVIDPKTSAPVAGETILLAIPGKRVQLYTSQTDAAGNFIINTKNLIGQNEIVVQSRLEQDSLLKIQIANPFSQEFSGKKVEGFSLQNELYNSLFTHGLSMQVQNLYVGEQIRQQYMPAIDTSAVYDGLQKVYLLDDYTRFTTMEEVLREYIHEVLVSKHDQRFRFRVDNPDYYMENHQPLVLFDGIPVYNFNKIIAADPLKVRQLDVVPNIYYMGADKEYGLLSFKTYKGDLGGVEIDPNALIMDYEGLQLKRAFFSPVYESQQQYSDHLPDFRTVLYWSPNLATDESGKLKVSFYTSDLTGKFIGVIQGVAADGKMASQTFEFEVKDLPKP